MADIVLLHYPGACSRVTISALEEIGVDYEDRTVNLSAGTQKSPEYVAINRKGKVPALIVRGKLLTENASILIHLDQLHPEALLMPSGEDPFEKACCVSDLVWCSSALHPMVRQIRNPQRWTLGESDGVKADGMEKFAVECAYMSARLAGNGWWLDDRWSIIDVYVYWAYSTAAKGGFPVGAYPHLVSHAERVRARPSFQRALEREVAAVERDELPLEIGNL